MDEGGEGEQAVVDAFWVRGLAGFEDVQAATEEVIDTVLDQGELFAGLFVELLFQGIDVGLQEEELVPEFIRGVRVRGSGGAEQSKRK